MIMAMLAEDVDAMGRRRVREPDGTDLAILRELMKVSETNQRQLSLIMKLPYSTVRGRLIALDAEGLVSSVVEPKISLVTVKITDAGRELMEARS
jgi:DNA-binding transcriptional ArsR family regulator